MDFEEFKRIVTGLFARYPGAQMSDATIPAWWAELRAFPRDALIEAFGRSPRGNPQFCPSCEVVREHAVAWRPPTPRADLSAPALEEPMPELPPELADIRDAQRRGEISPSDAAKAYLKWVVEKLP